MNGYVLNSEPELAIQVFQEMLESDCRPSNITLGIVLNTCAVLRSIELGKQIHGFIIKYRVGHDTSVGNSICNLYTKCGRLGAAIEAFKEIEEKNVISWTTVIAACAEYGKVGTGLRLFTEMLADGVEPNEFTLASVLSMCCTVTVLGLGEQVHAWSIKLGHVWNERVANSILYLYLKCGRIDKAEKLFDSLEEVYTVTWNVMISGYSELMNLAKDDLSAYDVGTEALRVFLKMNRSSSRPEHFSFSSVLSVCSHLLALEQGQQIHAQTLKTGYLSDVVVRTALVNMYSKCGSVEDASKAFEVSPRTLVTWTSMVSGFAHNGETREALQLFEDLRIAGIRPNCITFVGVLSACSHAGMLEEALRYFEMMKKDYKIKPIITHFGCLIDTFVRAGKMEEAFDFVKNMRVQPNHHIWSSLLLGCRHHGNTELGIYVAEKLLKLGIENTDTYYLILATFMAAGRSEDVGKVKELMKEKKLEKPMDLSWISVKDRVYTFKPDDPLLDHSAKICNFLDELLEKAKNLGYQQVDDDFKLIIADEEEGVEFSSPDRHSEKFAVAFGLLNTAEAAPVRITKSVSMHKNCHDFMKVVSSITGRKIIIQASKWLHKFADGRCSCGDYGCIF